MPWSSRLLLKYICTLLRVIPWRVRRVYRLKVNDYSLDSPDFATPPLKLGPTKVHRLTVTNYDVGSPSYSFPGDSPQAARARKWLLRFMRNNPDPRKLKPGHRTKKAIRRICRTRVGLCGLSEREFDYLWDFAIDQTGATAWREPGPKN
jgi:hypothetical protein